MAAPTVVQGMCLVVLLSIVFSHMGMPHITNFITRRVIAVPGLLTGYYFTFFSTSPKMSLSSSFLRGLVENPYGSSVPLLMGRVFFSDPDMAANANVFADAFANFGAYGVFLFSVLLGLILWFYDCAAVGKDRSLCTALLAMPAFALTDTALFTSLLTHGFLLAFLLVTLMPRERLVD